MALVGFAAAVQGMRFGLMSDLHLKLDYDPVSPSSKYCNPLNDDWYDWSDGSHELRHLHESGNPDQIALLGRLGCDASPQLVKYIAKLFVKINKKEPVDYILLTGDLIAHKLS